MRSAGDERFGIQVSTGSSAVARSSREHLGHVRLARQGGRLVERLQHLAHDGGLAQLADERVQPGAPARASRPGARCARCRALAQHGGRGAEIARVEKVGEQRLEDAEDLGPDRRLALDLEQVEQHVERGGAHVALVLLLHRRRHLVDLGFVEEVERRVELLEVHHALGPGRRLLGDLGCGAARPPRSSCATRGVGAGLLRQPGAGVAEELDELVLDELELLLPEQGEQVVARVGREEPRAVDRLQEAGQLLDLGAAADRERAHPVLEQPPGDAVALG